MAYAKAANRLYHYFKGGSYEGATLDLTTPFTALLLWAEPEAAVRGEESGPSENTQDVASSSLSSSPLMGSRGLSAALSAVSGARLSAPIAGSVGCGGGGTETLYTFGYWIPPARQGNPPKPADDSVIIVTVPEVTYYTRVFGGYAPSPALESQAKTLEGILDHEGQTYWAGGFLARIYDSPTKLWGRHNELSLFKHDPTDFLEKIFEQARARLSGLTSGGNRDQAAAADVATAVTAAQ